MVKKLFTQKKIDKKSLSQSNTNKTLENIHDEVIESGKDVDDIKEDVDDISDTVDDIKEDVDDIKEDVDELIKKHDSLLKKFKFKLKPDKFAFDDIAQQIVGAIIISSPLAVTAEVWMLANQLDIARIVLIFGRTLFFDILLIYFTKYQSVEKENIFKFIPLRLISLLIVSYLAAGLILFLFGVIGGQVNSVVWAAKLILFVGLFANIGAGAADMLK